ncbi:hypothetical protein [Flavobacterium sp. J27]|uniref:hypothetical protein n=1 Tax=Flavobacterium sp. J27 TaxID=2060419 RepID=UPI0010302BFC|nr:hypothetical protein [Flavobacterium sp. J27]
MTKFLFKIVKFLLLFTIGYPLTVFIIGFFLPYQFKNNIRYKMGSQGHLNTRLKEIKSITSEVDVLILGSSHAYRGINPNYFKNYSCFNLGSSLQTPLQTNILLKRYVKKLNPKVVCFEVYPDALYNSGLESSLDLISNDKNDSYSLEMALELNNLTTYNTLLYGYMNDFFKLSKNYKEPLIKNKDTYIKGGYVQREVEYFKSSSLYEKTNWKINNNQINILKENIELALKNNCKVILFFAPITKNFYLAHKNNHEFDTLMRSLHSNYKNFNINSQLDDSLNFYDPHHLNETGVKIFTKEFEKNIHFK